MPSPSVAGSVGELLGLIAPAARIDDERLTIVDEGLFRSEAIRHLAWSQTFAGDRAVVDAARWLIWEASQRLGSPSASIHELYMARGRGEVGGFTVPAINIRTQVFDMAASMCRVADELDAGTIIMELARSEQEYTFQRPGEYLSNVLAGCISAGWSGPVFVQGDHYQFNAKKYAADPEAVTEGLRRLIREALAVGYGNIDIDSSTLVDLSLGSIDEQQRTNYTRAAELTALIRAHEADGETTSVGGEIGEVGKQNSTEEELRAYLDGYRRQLSAASGDVPGLSKVSVQTGTSHGGVPLPGGGMAEVSLDFGVLERLSAVCREYGLAGAVQHGASTLPDELFHRFPQVETAEIHLATGFVNLLFDHAALADLRPELEAWCHANAADERKPDEPEDVFIYKTRKKSLGPFKRHLWDHARRGEILADQEAKMRFLFEQLGIAGSKELVGRYVRPVARSQPMPDVLRAEIGAAR
jgi:fructose/tagatose bisphosphate aldolase